MAIKGIIMENTENEIVETQEITSFNRKKFKENAKAQLKDRKKCPKCFEEIEKEFEGKGYGDFKTAVGEAVVNELAPIQARYKELIADKKYLEECMRKGAELATRISQRTLDKVMKKVGFYPSK